MYSKDTFSILIIVSFNSKELNISKTSHISLFGSLLVLMMWTLGRHMSSENYIVNSVT